MDKHEQVRSFISDLRVIGYNFLDDDFRCVIEGFSGHIALDVALDMLQNELIRLSEYKEEIKKERPELVRIK